MAETTTAQSNESYISQQLLAYLKSIGFTGQQLLFADAAFLGNIQQESGFRTSALAVNDGGPGVNAHGIVQWEGGRYTNLLNFAQSTGGNAGTIQTQTAFLIHELQNGYSSVISRLRGATSVSDAAQIVQSRYEGSTTASLGARQANASKIYSQLVAGTPLTGGGAASSSTPAQLTAFQGVSSGILPGPLDPLGLLPGDNGVAGGVSGAIGNAIVGPIEDVLGAIAGPIVRFLVNAFLIVSGVVIVVIAIVLLAKDSDDDREAPFAGDAEEEEGGGEHEEEKGGAEHDAEEAAVAE